MDICRSGDSDYSVITILFTATLGAWGVNWYGEKVLKPEE